MVRARRRGRLSLWLVVGGFAFIGGAFTLASIIILIVVSPFAQGPDGLENRTIRNSKGIPAEYLGLIIKAANNAGCREVTPALLAAQLRQESGFNPRARSPVGAMGIAQFMPGTWRTHGGGGDPWNPAHAIPAAARYDCAVSRSVASVSGHRQALMLAGYNAGPGAVLAYAGVPPYTETRNYVRVILAQAQVFGDLLAPVADVDTDVKPMIDFMKAQVGKRYSWGAEGPDAWDCSSLVQAAYRKIGIDLPRNTTDQLALGQRVAGVDPQPGDLLFIVGTEGTPSSPEHVGMYVGDGRVIAAKGARWGVVESALSDWTAVVAVTRPLAVRSE